MRGTFFILFQLSSKRSWSLMMKSKGNSITFCPCKLHVTSQRCLSWPQNLVSRCCLVIHSEYVDTHKYGHISDIQSRSRLGPIFLKIKGNWQQTLFFSKFHLKANLKSPFLSSGHKAKTHFKKSTLCTRRIDTFFKWLFLSHIHAKTTYMLF